MTFISSTGIGDTTIGYDHLHRITSYTGLGSYAYDAVGNITTSGESGTAQTYNYGVRRGQAVKTVTASGYNKKYLYDKCGNMIVRRGDTAGSQALDYDAENRLVRFSQAGTVIVEYGYAADGTRLWKRVNQDPSKLQVWIGNIYEEKEQGGTRKTLFHVFAGGQRICTFEPNSKLAGGTDTSLVSYYYHQDHLGSSSVLSDWQGNRLEINVWYPFGRTQPTSPTQQAPFKVSNQFTGQVKDEETGLYYYGARYYDPELGRFIQADTIIPDLGNPQSYNRYAYVLNNPLKYVDPDGHEPWYSFTYMWVPMPVVRLLYPNGAPIPRQVVTDPNSFLGMHQQELGGFDASEVRGAGARMKAAADVFPTKAVVDSAYGVGTGKNADTYEKLQPGDRIQAGGETAAVILPVARLAKTGGKAGSPARFVDGVTVTDRRAGTVFQGTVDLKPTLDRIASGKRFPHANDGSIFRNDQRLLPTKPSGYYNEFVHPTPGVSGPGPQRIVTGKGGEMYYSPDHYKTFIPINQRK